MWMWRVCRGHGLRALCVVVAGAACGSPLWSSRARHGAVVAVDAVHVLRLQSSPYVLWSRVWVMVFMCVVWCHGCHRCGACVMLWPSCVVVTGAAHHVAVMGAIIAVHALWLLPLCCVLCRCHPFCAVWGVAGAFVVSGVVLWQLQEGLQWGGQEGHGDVAHAAGKGVMGWGHVCIVIVVGNNRQVYLDNFLLNVALSSPHDRGHDKAVMW